MSKAKQPTYSQALSELEQLIGEIEAEEVDVDDLTEKVKRAASLIKFCQTRLRNTEEDVKKALAEMEAVDAEGDEPEAE
ncbi:MAG TPA: exodeoxyribonuclease VII small subunit [Dissulfurispiraceae bacterium]